MANPVWSSPFIQYTSETPNTQYEVPAGFTAIIRQISGYQSAGGFVMYVIIQDSSAAPGLFIWSGGQAGVANYVGVEGRWVVPEGGIITAEFSELFDSPCMYVGGYLIRNSAT